MGALVKMCGGRGGATTGVVLTDAGLGWCSSKATMVCSFRFRRCEAAPVEVVDEVIAVGDDDVD